MNSASWCRLQLAANAPHHLSRIMIRLLGKDLGGALPVLSGRDRDLAGVGLCDRLLLVGLSF